MMDTGCGQWLRHDYSAFKV